MRGKRGAAHARKLQNSKPMMVRVAELSKPDSNREAADCGDVATMLSKLEDARLLAMAKMQPAPAVYAVLRWRALRAYWPETNRQPRPIAYSPTTPRRPGGSRSCLGLAGSNFQKMRSPVPTSRRAIRNDLYRPPFLQA